MWWEATTYLFAVIGAVASVCIIFDFFRKRRDKQTRVLGEVALFQAAQQMSVRYGDNALRYAATRAFSFSESGDVEGFNAWKQIYTTIDELQPRHLTQKLVAVDRSDKCT